jgi:hypothetical protein
MGGSDCPCASCISNLMDGWLASDDITAAMFQSLTGHEADSDMSPCFSGATSPSISAATTPFSSFSYSGTPSRPISPNISTSPLPGTSRHNTASGCGIAETAALIITCPFCPETFAVAPQDTAICPFGQHLLGHGVPTSSRLQAEWSCIWPDCRCQGQGRDKLKRCLPHGGPGLHTAHVINPWHHIKAVHLNFQWMCKCGRGPFKSKNSLTNHIRPPTSESRIVKRRRSSVRSVSALPTSDRRPFMPGPVICRYCSRTFSGDDFDTHHCVGLLGLPASY